MKGNLQFIRFGTFGRTAVLLLLLAVQSGLSARAEGKAIRVFVALCDNATQGIIKVPAKIGDGNDLDNNLYWGCDEGLRSVFRASARWSRISAERNVETSTPVVLEELTFKHKATSSMLTASAYRGSQMRKCIEDFEAAIRSGVHDLVVFIGHNGLMDGSVEWQATAAKDRKTAVMVLCCMSASYFSERIAVQGGEPLLLTTQLMYPGAFIVRDALEPWLSGQGREAVRNAAAEAYAKNQGISVKSARGIFWDGKK